MSTLSTASSLNRYHHQDSSIDSGVLTSSLFYLQYAQVSSKEFAADDYFGVMDANEFDDEVPAQKTGTSVLRDINNIYGWKARQNPEKYPITRFRFLRPWGNDQEEYCFQKLLLGRPLRAEDVEQLLNEHGSFLNVCINFRLLDKETEAKHYLATAATRGYHAEKLREFAQVFIENNWLSDMDIDGLLESVAPGQLEIAKHAEQFFNEGDDDSPEALRHYVPKPTTEFLANFSDSQRKSYLWITERWMRKESVRCLVTGGAGVGKSYLMDALTSFCRESDLTFARTATTGMAAHIVHGTTLHAFLRMKGDGRPDLEKGSIGWCMVKNTDVIFIDEVSMLTQDLLECLDSTVIAFQFTFVRLR